MTATALGLVLVAALLHATWNLLAKRTGGGAASDFTPSLFESRRLSPYPTA